MVDPALGLTIVFNGCIYNYQELRAELEAKRLPLLLHRRHRGHPQGLSRLGPGLRRRASTACSPSPSTSATAAGWCSAATASASSRSTCAPANGRLRFASTLPALLAGGDIDTSIDRVALHHYMSFHAVVPPPRTILQGRAQAAAGDRARHRARRRDQGHPLLDAELRARRRRPRGHPRGMARPRPGGAAPGGGAAHGRRRAGRRAALRRRRFQPHRRAARRSRPERPDDLLHRLRGGQRREGRRVRLFRPHRRALRHRPPQDLHRVRRA